MEKKRHYEFEGVVLEIPLRYDALSGMYIEMYPDFISNPVRTPEGYPVLFSGEDACSYAEADDGGECLDCSSCRFFRPAASHTWIGVCGHEKKRWCSSPKSDGTSENEAKVLGKPDSQKGTAHL